MTSEGPLRLHPWPSGLCLRVARACLGTAQHRSVGALEPVRVLETEEDAQHPVLTCRELSPEARAGPRMTQPGAWVPSTRETRPGRKLPPRKVT